MAHQHFDGETYEEEHDEERLSRQIIRVRSIMLDGQWRTLAEIAAITGDPQASISARLRDLRKRKFGSYIVNRRRRGLKKHGLFEYQLLPRLPDNEDQQQPPKRKRLKPTANEIALVLQDLRRMNRVANENGFISNHEKELRKLGTWLKHLAGKE